MHGFYELTNCVTGSSVLEQDKWVFCPPPHKSWLHLCYEMSLSVCVNIRRLAKSTLKAYLIQHPGLTKANKLPMGSSKYDQSANVLSSLVDFRQQHFNTCDQ
ncbi:Hypothetical predicted protein [Podarcis lilfordi]|uniref:Uncharacterized protein n=1 Tax=Podarcis lilfordi TaxID=74358 RepID=A0AA35P7U0_9SAUR|nr:Hypothetical predicted protein [Podarcis lilfordi]